jgi:hypothetical protein
VTFLAHLFNVQDFSGIRVFVVEYFRLEDAFSGAEIETINWQNDIILKSHSSDDEFRNMADENTYSLLQQCALKIGSSSL